MVHWCYHHLWEQKLLHVNSTSPQCNYQVMLSCSRSKNQPNYNTLSQLYLSMGVLKSDVAALQLWKSLKGQTQKPIAEKLQESWRRVLGWRSGEHQLYWRGICIVYHTFWWHGLAFQVRYTHDPIHDPIHEIFGLHPLHLTDHFAL